MWSPLACGGGPQRDLPPDRARPGQRRLRGSAHRPGVRRRREDRHLTAPVILVATGSVPNRGRDLPMDDPRFYDSDSILAMSRLPRRLAVIGAGAHRVRVRLHLRRAGDRGPPHRRAGAAARLHRRRDRRPPAHADAAARRAAGDGRWGDGGDHGSGRGAAQAQAGRYPRGGRGAGGGGPARRSPRGWGSSAPAWWWRIAGT